MKQRLNRIVTRTGDRGETGLSDGSRLSKGHQRIETLGSVDELNSHLGLLACLPGLTTDWLEQLTHIQHQLFELGGELAIPGHYRLDDSDLNWLEQQISVHNSELPPLMEFVLPGGSPANAQAHVARTCCRKAERDWVRLSADTELNPISQAYLNRLSDYLFVLSRRIQQQLGLPEFCWNPKQLTRTQPS